MYEVFNTSDGIFINNYQCRNLTYVDNYTECVLLSALSQYPGFSPSYNFDVFNCNYNSTGQYIFFVNQFNVHRIIIH